jgi:hypothetical protein
VGVGVGDPLKLMGSYGGFMAREAKDFSLRKGFVPASKKCLLYSIFSLLRSLLFRRSPHGDLSNFDPLLTKYVNNDNIHVQTNWEHHLLIKTKPCGTLHFLAKGLQNWKSVNLHMSK